MKREDSGVAGWQLRLFGKFSLADPSGAIVRLPDRKTEGLMAILALHREFGIERQEAANIFWPGRSGGNLANLRQSLSILRRVLGSDSIEGSRGHCRLTSVLSITSDFEHPNLRECGGFMPGHAGDWFDEMRSDDFGSEELSDVQPTVVANFLKTLRWYSEHDPRGMFALLSAAPSMGRSIPYADMSSIIQPHKGNEACLGWHSYWRGTVEDDLEVCIPHLRLALRIARDASDLPLASEACLELGKAYSRTGRLAQALKICDIADVVATRSKALITTTNALRLRGTVLLNWQDPTVGFDLFLRAEQRIEDPIEYAFTQSTRAFFEASLGLHERAEVTLAQSLAMARDLGHFRISLVSAFTRTILHSAGCSRTDAMTQLLDQASHCYAIGVTQIGVYAEEYLAKLYLLEGDKAGAAHRRQSARTNRLSARMAVTPLEARRMSGGPGA